jgi:phosphoglycerate dehydrogenase-like enzyme
MADGRPLVAVTFHLDREQLAELFGDEVRAESVAGMPEEERARTLEAADALLVWNWRRELWPEEGPALGARFVQLISADADQLPFDQVPLKAVVASNVGAYAEPMAEHALAMGLALLKRLPQGHAKLAAGVFDQSPPAGGRGGLSPGSSASAASARPPAASCGRSGSACTPSTPAAAPTNRSSSWGRSTTSTRCWPRPTCW